MTARQCCECGEVKALSEYYASYRSRCKDCVKAQAKRNRLQKLDHYQAYDRQRGNLPHRVEARLAYQKTEAGKSASYKASVRWKRLNPVKRAAHVAVYDAVRFGKLKRQACEVCGATKSVCAHHDDYSKPLDVRWLCRQCHADWHKHNTAKESSELPNHITPAQKEQPTTFNGAAID